MNKAFINGRIVNVVDYNEIRDHVTDFVDLKDYAVIIGDCILPIRTQYSNSFDHRSEVGMYITKTGFVSCTFPGSPTEKGEYSISHLARIGDANSFAELVAAKNRLYEDEYRHLISSDNVFVSNTNREKDTPLAYAMKTAIDSKHCDVNHYANRFGTDFNNDKRKLSSNDVTANKYANITKNFDIRTTLILENMTPDGVPNPMPNRVIVTLVGDGKYDHNYEEFYRKAISGQPDLTEIIQEEPETSYDEEEDDE